MIKIAPFEGIRYKSRDISRLICPPYDIISAQAKKKLLSLDKNNFVSVELPSPSYNFRGETKLYERAKDKFFFMLKNGVMTRDRKSFYIYEQSFNFGGKKITRTGLIASVRLENPIGGKIRNRNIFPHEKILKKPAAERNFLLRKLRAQTSAVFFISNSKTYKKTLSEAQKHSTLVSRGKMDGITHTLRRIDGNSTAAKRLIKFFLKRNEKIFIADGHHRYNVAWQYSRSVRKNARLKNQPPHRPEDYVLGFIAPGIDRNLLILPTHRIVQPPQDIASRIRKHFREISKNAYKKYLSSRRYKNGQLPQPIIARLDKKTFYLSPKTNNRQKTKAELYLENLAPQIASRTILKDIPLHQISYTHSLKEALARADKEKKLALIFPPPAIQSVIEISSCGKVMPQKSTYFHPKVYAGIVTYPFF